MTINQQIKIRIVFLAHNKIENDTAHRITAYTLRAYAFALRDIAPFGRNVVYAENVI